MSIFVGKLLTRLLLPLPVALGVLVLALLLLASGRRKAAGACVFVALLGVWILATPVFSDRLAADLESVHAAPPLASLPSADAILLLGGATKPAVPPREFPELVDAADRIVHAARLFHAGKAPVIVASGGPPAWQKDGPAEATALVELLVTFGVPESAIVREEASGNTRENCTETKRLLDARGASDVLLVTSALHMRRALATCRSAGLRVHPAPTDFWVAHVGPRTALDWIPDAEAFLLTHFVMRERVGFEVYRFRGWIRE